jgi:hypothetical protein
MLGSWADDAMVCSAVLNPGASYPLSEHVFPAPMFEIDWPEPST